MTRLSKHFEPNGTEGRRREMRRRRRRTQESVLTEQEALMERRKKTQARNGDFLRDRNRLLSPSSRLFA